MIQVIAFAIIIAGIYFIIKGFTESAEMQDYHILNRFDDKESYGGEEELHGSRKRKRKVKGGGVILIGPIPIVFGESRYAVVALVLAIVLMVLSFFFIFGGEIQFYN